MKNRSACIAFAFLFYGLTALNEATRKKERTNAMQVAVIHITDTL